MLKSRLLVHKTLHLQIIPTQAWNPVFVLSGGITGDNNATHLRPTLQNLDQYLSPECHKDPFLFCLHVITGVCHLHTAVLNYRLLSCTSGPQACEKFWISSLEGWQQLPLNGCKATEKFKLGRQIRCVCAGHRWVPLTCRDTVSRH